MSAVIETGDGEDELLGEIITPKYPDNPFEVLGESNFHRPEAHGSECAVGTPVQEFFRDKVVLVTGGTGFVGRVLLEKLLRTCPRISHIYLLVRKTKNRLPEHALDVIFENRLYKRLKCEVPNYRKKLSVIIGDINQPGLGLSNDDTLLLKRMVHIVYHCAASVRFDVALRDAVLTNSFATNEIINLVRSFENLKAFMYLSTAFAFCANSMIDETVPPLPESLRYHNVLLKIETLDANTLKSETTKIISPWPNTYVFSKALTESVVGSECKTLPAGIFRPSVIISTYREPVRGWVDSFRGFLSGCLGVALGYIHVCYIPKNIMATDMVPVDLVVNALICATKEVHDDFHAIGVSHPSRDTPVYNYVNGSQNPISWKDLMEYSLPYVDQWSSMHSVWYHAVILTYNRVVFAVLWFFLHVVAGFILDFATLLSGNEPTLTKEYNRYFRLYRKVGYFSCREWSFRNERVRRLWEKLSVEDKKLFFFDMTQVDWKSYLATLILGGRTYALKETFCTLPRARRRMKRLYYIHLIVKFSFISGSVAGVAFLLFWILRL